MSNEIATEMTLGTITVRVGDVVEKFRGQWDVVPDSWHTRSTEDGQDAGAYYGVATTAKGNIAVYRAHCNDMWSPTLDEYPSLDAAVEADALPADIKTRALAAQGQPIWRDI
jgi:hypothetical protein